MISTNAGVPPTATAATPESSVPATVTIVIKNVYRNTTIELALPVTEALSSVKKAIREQFDEHPAPDQQRLIYLGKVCSNDSLPLKDLLSQSRMDVKNPQTFHLVLNNGARGQAGQSPSQPLSLANGPPQSPLSPTRRTALSSTPPPPGPQTFLPESLSSTSREDELAQSSREVALPSALLPTVDTLGAGLSPPPEALLGRASPTPMVAPGEAPSTAASGGWFSVSSSSSSSSSSSGSEGLRRRRPESLSSSSPPNHPHHPQARPTHAQGHTEPPTARPTMSAASTSTSMRGAEGALGRALTVEELAWYRHYYSHYYHAQHMAARAAQHQQQHQLHQMYSISGQHHFYPHGAMPDASGYGPFSRPPMPMPMPSPYDASVPPPLAPALPLAVANGPLVCLLESLRVQAGAVLALCDWQLAAKMVMLVFLLNPGDPTRMATVCCLAFMAYLYQTGILALFLGPMFGRPRDPQDDADQAQPQPQPRPRTPPRQPPQEHAHDAHELELPQAPLAAEATAPAPPALEHGLLADLTNQARELGNGVISDEGGFWVDVYVLSAAFVLSLFPTWQPRSAAAPQPARPAMEVPAN